MMEGNKKIIKRKRFRFSPCLLGFLLSLLVFSCRGEKSSELKRDDLFSISLGTLPDELDWFSPDGFQVTGALNIDTHDGLVYVLGEEMGKLMVFNSYGNLLTLVSNPTRNTFPLEKENSKKIQIAKSWNFRDPRLMAVYREGFIVDDGVEETRLVEDASSGAGLERVLLYFNHDGDYLGYLGREGFGGTPFPFITSLDVREDGGLVVTCRVANSWMSYWYDAEGQPTATVLIGEEELPTFGEDRPVSVYSIRPDPLRWVLHIRMDVYHSEDDGRAPEARLYTLDLASLEYEKPIDIAYTEGNLDEGFPPIPFDYLGSTIDGSHVFIGPQGTGVYGLIVLDGEGRITMSKNFYLRENFLERQYFRLQNDGLLIGIFLGDSKAMISWWRLDKLLNDVP